MKLRVFTASFLITLAVAVFALAAWLYTPTLLNRKAFTNVIEDSGILKTTPQNIFGYSGAAWSDYDNDGFLDLLLSREFVKLYKNNGNDTFTDVTEKSGLGNKKAAAGFFADYDNDGCPDLYLSGENSLLHNNCAGSFDNVTQKAGIKPSVSPTGAAWADYDSDGYLDLYVANFGQLKEKLGNNKRLYLSEPNFLYRNNGNGTFTDVAEKTGTHGVTQCLKGFEKDQIESPGGPYKESFQPIWFDYNNDRKIDLFVATDRGISPLYKNGGGGTFTDVTREAGLCRFNTGMGVTAGDYDSDGNMDLYLTNFGPNYLWHNMGTGSFTEKAAETNTADHSSVGWGTQFFDYDNDGSEDIYVVNGAAKDEVGVPSKTGSDFYDANGIEKDASGKIYAGNKLDRLYKNDGHGKFKDVSEAEGIAGSIAKGAGALADFDNNGFADIFVVPDPYEQNAPYSLYKNRGNSNNWITIKLIGTKSNRDAIGARIILKAGGKTQTREVLSSSSFLSQNSLWQTFGLGKTQKIDSIEILWPSGQKQTIVNQNPGQTLTVREQ
ncbi:MAG: CRTAC1 family protein [Candidatus Curtissbacteria bacterium]